MKQQITAGKLLSRAHQLLAKERWTQGELARNIMGDQVHANDITAYAFSLLGSVYRAYFDLTGRYAHNDSCEIDSYLRYIRRDAREAYEKATDALYATIKKRYDISGIISFNDEPGLTKNHMLAILDEARQSIEGVA